MTKAAPPKLLYLVAEDWAFVSHRIGLALAAKNAGYDVVVATRTGKADHIIRDAGLRVVSIPFSRSGMNPLHELKTLTAILALYRKERPNIIHHVAVKPVIYGSIAARLVRGPAVVNALVGLGYVFSSDTLKARVLRPFVRRLLQFALGASRTRLIVQNSDDFAMFASEGLACPDHIRLIRGSGVDPAKYKKCDARGLGSTGPVVVLPARMLKDKGVVEFVEAAKTLRAKGVTARFVLCGEPDPINPASLTEAELRKYQSDGHIEYWGWQKDMSNVWRQAQIVCLPSYREGLPKALLEAAASSLPVVATDVPGCREICRDGVNGWLVPVRNSAKLAEALLIAIERPDLREEYGRRGREMIENELSLHHVVTDTLRLYRDLAETA